MLNKITDKGQIEKILDANLFSGNRKLFIAAVFSREHRAGGIVYEGAQVIGKTKGETGTKYSFSNSDSNYTRSIAFLDISKIEWLQIV